jgi:LuxR family maltose regulon positive regulatory protein
MERKMQGSSSESPTGYYLQRDPDTLILFQLDGTTLGPFSAWGAAPQAVLGAIEQTGPQRPSADLEEAAATPASHSARSSCELRASFFGHFEIFCNGEVVSLGRNGKALTILKYLLADRSRPVSQDHLMGWLWPHSNLKKARWSLNSAIHILRKLLSSCPSGATAKYIVLKEGYYHLCPTVRVETDVDEFDAHSEQGRRLEKANRTEEAAAEYERAVELYRGDYLIENLYEDWTMVERERLSDAYVDMLGRLAVHYMESGRLQESIRACYKLLEKDRCHEDSYRLLMRYYASLGLRSRALRHYRLCKEVLEQEYGTAPSPETQALHRSIVTRRATG